VSALSPAGGAWTGSRKLSWTYADAAGLTQHKISVDVSTDPTFGAFVAQSGQISHSASSWTIPSTVGLLDGTTYYWRVSVYNGKSWSSPVSESFRWDASKPGWSGPAFISPAAKTDQTGSSFTYSWNPASDLAGISGYQISEQVASIKSPNSCASDWISRVTVTGASTSYATNAMAAGKCDRLKLQAIDGAGNMSSAVYSAAIIVDTTAPPVPGFTDNAAAVGAHRSGNTIYFVPGTKGTVKITVAASDPESGIASATFGALSVPTGWTYTPGTLNGAAPSKNLTWSAKAGPATMTLTVTDGAGLTSPPLTITLAPDSAPPVGDFATPNEGTTTLQAGTSYSVAWTEADSGSGVASRSIIRQRAPIAIPGSCAGLTWTADVVPSSSASPLAVGDLVSGYCYQWVLTLTDNVGNSASYASGAVLVDAATPDLPSVTSSGSGYQPGLGGSVYVNGSTAGSVTLTATPAGSPASGVACELFGSLTPGSGWTPGQTLPYCSPANPYSLSLRFGPSTTAATLQVVTTNGAGTSSDPATVALVPDRAAPTAGFTSPTPGTTTEQSSTTYGVAWTEADAGSGVAGRSIVRQRAAVAIPGSCTGLTWTTDGVPSSSASPLALSDLVGGYCYQWVLTLTDNVGNSASYTSGSVLVNTTPPSAPTISTTTPAGTYRSGGTIYFTPTGGGTITLTASATDPESEIASFDFGALSASTGWTYSGGQVTGNPASVDLTWSSAAVATTISVSATDGAGLSSDPAVITLTPDPDAPSGAFSAPASGATATISSTTYSVAWTETDAGSGVAGRSLQRKRAPIVTAGTCDDVSWDDDGDPSGSASPLALSDLVGGYCYQWVLTLTDNVGNSASYTSGSVLVNTTSGPELIFTSPAFGTTLTSVQTSYEVAWTESDPTGVTSRSLQRQRTSLGADGTCDDSAWADDGDPLTAASPVSGNDLMIGFCYRWLLSATNGAGGSSTTTSGTQAASHVALESPLESWTLFSTETLEASLANGESASGIDFLVDGVVVGSAAIAPYTFALDTTALSDGSHSLAVRLDGEATYQSPPASITIDNASSVLERLYDDYEAGRLSLDEYALQSTYAYANTSLVGSRYESSTPMPELPELAWTDKWDQLSPDTQAKITRLVAQPSFYWGPPVNPPPSTPDPLFPECDSVTRECEHTTGHFEIGYTLETSPGSNDGVGRQDTLCADLNTPATDNNSQDPGRCLGAPSAVAGDGVPDLVDQYAYGLEHAYDYYTDQSNGLGFPAPVLNGLIPVGLQPEVRGSTFPCAEPVLWCVITLPMSTKDSPDALNNPLYLASHELFHRFQYIYAGLEDFVPPIDNPHLMWAESTADWAAHEALASWAFANTPVRDTNPTRYAQDLSYYFSDVADERLDYGPGIGDNRDYGTWILAEYMAQSAGTPKIITRTWMNIGLGVRGSIVEAVQHYCGNWAEFLQDYSVANYLFSSDPKSYPSEPDATSHWPGLNLHVAQDNADVCRNGACEITGSLGAADGGAHYLELDLPPGTGSGLLSVSVTGPIEMGVEVISLPAGSHSTSVCGVYEGDWHPSGAAALYTATITVHVTASCPDATLVVVNTYFQNPYSGRQSFVTYSATLTSAQKVATIRTPLQSSDGPTSINHVIVDGEGNSYVYDGKVTDEYGDGSYYCTSCGGWLRKFDAATHGQVWAVQLDLSDVSSITISDADTKDNLPPAAVVTGTDANSPWIEAFELDTGGERYKVEPWMGGGGPWNVPTYALSIAPGPEGGIYYLGGASCTYDCDYNGYTYVEVVDGTGHRVSENQEPFSIGKIWSSPDRKSYYMIQSGKYTWQVGYDPFVYCLYYSTVLKFAANGLQDQGYSGPSLSTPCVDPPVIDRWYPQQIVQSWSAFSDLAIDPDSGNMYLLQTDYALDPSQSFVVLQSHEIDEYSGSMQIGSGEAVEQLMGPGPAGGLNQEPIVFTAVNSELVVAGTHYKSDGSAVAEVAVSNELAAPSYIWLLKQVPSGNPTPLVNTPPSGDLPFSVTCVAANESGDIYVGGSSLGSLDGRSLAPSVWVGGWLTQFYAPITSP
jgi:hypothetical protein